MIQEAASTAFHTCASRYTGKERDTESGNDYMFARYYNSATGRFLSPDWSAKAEPVPYAKLGDPQSLNLYSYVLNNPLSRADADGHCPGEGAGQSSPSDCGQVKVAATPATQPAPVHTTTVTDPNGKDHTDTGPSGVIHFTVTANGTPVDGVKVTETNQSTTKAGTQTITGGAVEGEATSKNGGKYQDTVGAGLPVDKVSPADAAKAYNGTPVTITDTQTQTLTFPNGCACTATSTRTTTNIGPGGAISPSGYTLTTTQPVVTTPQPPQ